MTIRRNPGRHRAVGFPDHAISWYGSGFHWLLDANDEVSQHSRTQLIVRVRDLGTDGDSMSIRINHLVNLRNLSLEYAIGIGHHFDLDRLPDVKIRTLAFRSVRQHPFERDVGDRVRRWRIPWLHQESRLSVLRCDLAGNWTAHDQRGIDLARSDHLIDFGVGLPKDEDRVPCGFQGALSSLFI